MHDSGPRCHCQGERGCTVNKEYRITAFDMKGKPQTYIATGKEELAEIVLSFKGDKLLKIEEIES